VRQGNDRFDVPVTQVTPVDATGAGDQFAAGFLFGLASDRPLDVCGAMGVLAASEVIGHVGPRPKANIGAMLKQAGLL
jgi:sugar/nucleoside kinase (ribokinase family)